VTGAASGGDRDSVRGAGDVRVIDGRVELRPSAAFAVLFIASGLALAALGTIGLMQSLPGWEEGSRHSIFAATTIGLALSVAGLGVAMARNSKPVLVADRRGLHHLPRFRAGWTMAWEEIAAVGCIRRGKHRGLGIWVRDRDAWIAARSAVERPLLRLSAAMGRADRRIGVMALPSSIEAFAAEVAKRFGVELR
jgi:hypothetical protein